MAVAKLIEMKFSGMMKALCFRRRVVGATLALAFLSACATSTPAPVRVAATGPIQAASQEAERQGGGIRVDVKKGDSVYALSQRYGATARAIIDANSLRPPYVLQPGQSLFIPSATLHVVARGETLYSISRNYNVDMASLAKLNGMRDPYRLNINQLLKIPSVRFAALSSGTSVASGGSGTSSQPVRAAARDSGDGRSGSAKVRPAELPRPAPRSGKSFAWPVRGDVVMAFGPRPDGYHNDGINIAVPTGTAVHAAENGVVGYAGNELMGYGNLLLVRHADGWITAYAHNSELLVERGDQVRRGEVVARSGDSGKVTQPQLHFEVRKGKEAINPIDHLVAGRALNSEERLAMLEAAR